MDGFNRCFPLSCVVLKMVSIDVSHCPALLRKNGFNRCFPLSCVVRLFQSSFPLSWCFRSVSMTFPIVLRCSKNGFNRCFPLSCVVLKMFQSMFPIVLRCSRNGFNRCFPLSCVVLKMFQSMFPIVLRCSKNGFNRCFPLSCIVPSLRVQVLKRFVRHDFVVSFWEIYVLQHIHTISKCGNIANLDRQFKFFHFKNQHLKRYFADQIIGTDIVLP